MPEIGLFGSEGGATDTRRPYPILARSSYDFKRSQFSLESTEVAISVLAHHTPE
jgi:hypothetical protein